MKHVYHYCAMYQDKKLDLVYVDGVMETTMRVLTHDQYIKIKDAVRAKIYVPDKCSLTLLSLSRLGDVDG